MTDIVERLRNTCAGTGDVATADMAIHDEAADEITRLREANKELAEALGKVASYRDGALLPKHAIEYLRDEAIAVLYKHKGELK